ncbi:hypothetical protein [Streptomyces sp. MST-110588]|uniref:hypothetical protein n=1 Tax=Streptomyces sp. MST-110588 TaxID=2833628 RepID=UPI001F5DD924|nr:hypothetical protein [Streptomyces sp. MST-110588]UNO38716.1 hypothetical protein KGS77_02450 [Streptomyces sp. MST-110588]
MQITAEADTLEGEWLRIPTRHALPAATFTQSIAVLAALEERRIPIDAWALALESVGLSVPRSDLWSLAAAVPDVIATETDPHAPTEDSAFVRFVSEAAHRAARRDFPLSPQSYSTMVQVLVTSWLQGRTPPETAVYMKRTAPVHAALAGQLDTYLETPSFLAGVEAYGVCQGLGVAYPDGVPSGGIAFDLHYLEAQGLREATSLDSPTPKPLSQPRGAMSSMAYTMRATSTMRHSTQSGTLCAAAKGFVLVTAAPRF